MHRNPSEQSNRSLLQLLATTASAVGMVVCAVSTAYSFSVGPLPGENCFGSTTCNLAQKTRFYEEVHQKITDVALFKRSFTLPSGGAPVQFTKQALVDIKDGNALTDYFQGYPELHFDNASLVDSGNRLIEGKEYLISVLSPPYILTEKDGPKLRRVLGWYLHTLQDFYAHSNYVNLATPPSIKLGVKLPPTQPPLTSPCEFDSTSNLSLEGLNGLLTTGWAIGGGILLDLALARSGQCAHGLSTGIHKDWQGRAGHEQAFTYAVDASYEFVRSIVTDPSITNKNNVCMLMSGKPCDTSATCPDDPSPNITVFDWSTGGVYESKPVASFNYTIPTGGSISASGSKGNVGVSANMPVDENQTADISARYRDTFIVTSPGKSGTGQALMSFSASNTTNVSCDTEGDNFTQASSFILASYFGDGSVEGRSGLYKNCFPTTIPEGSPTSSQSISFTYGARQYFDVLLRAYASAPLPNNTSASSSAGVGYSVTVPSDPAAKVTWCRAAP